MWMFQELWNTSPALKKLDVLTGYTKPFGLKFDFTAKLSPPAVEAAVTCRKHLRGDWCGNFDKRAHSFEQFHWRQFALTVLNCHFTSSSTAHTQGHFTCNFLLNLRQLEFRITLGFLNTPTYIVVFPLYTLRSLCSLDLITYLIYQMSAFDVFPCFYGADWALS